MYTTIQYVLMLIRCWQKKQNQTITKENKALQIHRAEHTFYELYTFIVDFFLVFVVGKAVVVVAIGLFSNYLNKSSQWKITDKFSDTMAEYIISLFLLLLAMQPLSLCLSSSPSFAQAIR